MTDAKELAARLRELAHNEAYRSREHELDAAHSIMDAAAALEARDERLAALDQAAAPLRVYLSSVFADYRDEAEFPVQLGTLRALARAAGGDNG